MEDHPENLPILDTGATHCLLPITWLGAVIYAKGVISVGQLKGMLDLRMIWDDSSPLIVVCCRQKVCAAASKCGASPLSGVQEGAARDPQRHSRLYCQRGAVEHPQMECSSEQDPG